MKKYIALLLLSLVFVTPTFATSRSCPSGTIENPEYDPQDDTSEECVDAPVIPDSVTGLACIKTALEQRDTAITTAFDAYVVSAKASLQKRVTSLRDAWDVGSQVSRKAEIKNVWTVFKREVKAANAKLRTDKKTAWTKYATEKAKCKGITLSDDSGVVGNDTAL